MKKLFTIAIIGIALLSSTNTASAANHVSNMAVSKGGRHVAECARNMDKGISECVTMTECDMNK